MMHAIPCTPCNHADPYLLSPINLLYHDYRNFSFKTEYIYIDIMLFVKSPLIYPIMDHDMERCLVLQNMPSVTPFIIWLAPRGGKMNQIARCNWLPKRARWSHLALSGLPAVSLKQNVL